MCSAVASAEPPMHSYPAWAVALVEQRGKGLTILIVKTN